MQEISNRTALSEAFATASIIREVENRLLRLFAEGKLFGTVHTCIGQEMIGVAVARALEAGDILFSNHRCHGHFLARTGNVEGLIAEVMGKASGVCGGRGGSQHLCDTRNGFFSNGVQGGIAPVAAGLAMSLQLRGQGNIAVVFLGDGTLGEGVVYETFNLTSKWDLPVLFVLENNFYSQSTPQTQNLAGNILARAAAFDIPVRCSSTWEPEQLLEVTAECIAKVRNERRPFFLQVDTYRLMPHSKGDDDRDPEEIASHWARDPLRMFYENCPEEDSSALEKAKGYVDVAVAVAEASPYAQSYSEDGGNSFPDKISWKNLTEAESGTLFVASLRESLRRNLKRDPRLIFVGEDIESPYGGAFKVTKGLSAEFPERVRNTPISEAAIVGLGNGLALGGYIAVCEIMFGDFLTLIADQWINHASKFRYMYNNQVSVPLIVRTPMGGRRGYGPTHSQSLEKHFLGTPHTQVVALNSRVNPGKIYDELFLTVDRPTLVIENKLLYTSRLGSPVPNGFVLELSDEHFPTCRLRPLANPEITVFCYGGMLAYVEEAAARAFDELEIVAEVICPSRIYPLDPRPIIESLKRTRKLLIAEEGQSFAALGSELIAQISEFSPGLLRACKRLSPPEHPIPACGPLEKEILPATESIVSQMRELSRHV
ncbi:MAG TPA: thiamine pyrophosphate-dependent enzyme [Candidatus Saccharimonadales bacterium]|jgi:2-oxoisovalerate dehydrogenase E1 component|nr:thiamine pyrophosphate-dependent enzyme [Candidatus Saccharimonadales bacterium]